MNICQLSPKSTRIFQRKVKVHLRSSILSMWSFLPTMLQTLHCRVVQPMLNSSTQVNCNVGWWENTLVIFQHIDGYDLNFRISLAFGVWSQSLSLRISKDILGPFSFFVCCCLCLFGMDVHFTNIICPWRSSQSHHELSIMDSLHFPNILMLTLLKKWRPIEPLETPSIFKCNINVNVLSVNVNVEETSTTSSSHYINI